MIADRARSALDRHLERHVRLWLGLRADSPAEPPAVPASLARRLLRVEELERSHRDQWGNFEFGFAESHGDGTLWTPEVDDWAAARRRELAVRVSLEPLWPAGHRFAVCSTHDVDMVSRQMTPAQAMRGIRAALAPMPDGSRELPGGRAFLALRAAARAAHFGVTGAPPAAGSLERCLAVERRMGVTGSYLFTVPPAQPTPYDCVYDGRDRCRFRGRRRSVAEIARALGDEGIDVGLHGSFRSAVDPAILGEERERLEEITGRRVTSIRQHYLRFDTARTPRVQEASGLRTDSTLGFNRNVGFRAGTSLPFHPFDLRSGSAVGVLEVPLIIQDSALVATGALELDRGLAKAVVTRLIDAVARAGGVATLLFHPHTLLDPDLLATYRFSLAYAADQGAWVASLAAIDRWWRARASRLLAAEAA